MLPLPLPYLAGLAGAAALALFLAVPWLAWRVQVHDLRGWSFLGVGLGLLPLALGAALVGEAYPVATYAAGGLAFLGLLLALAGLVRLSGEAAALRASLAEAAGRHQALERGLAAGAAELEAARGDLRALREEFARVVRSAEGNEGQWRSLAEHAPTLILTLDREGTIVFANRRLPGVDSPHALGVNLYRVLPPEPAERLRAAVARVFATGEGASVEATLPGAPGASWLLRVGPVRRGAEVVSAVVIATDVTELKRAGDAVRQADEQRRALLRLEEANLFKTQLLDTAAHELSNPLQSIQLQFAVLKMGGVDNLSERQRQALDVMQRSFRRLRLLVQDMRDLTRIQNGKLRLQPQPTDVAQLAAEAVEVFQEPAKLAGVGLEAHVADSVEVVADGDRLAQVLSNLVSNALKFTPRGGLVVVEASREQGQAVLRVRDTGKGLVPEQMAKLFKPFSQVHQPGEVQEKGTGLGLYICKNLVEAHGGRIGVESEGPGHGCTFTVALPLALPTEAPRVPA